MGGSVVGITNKLQEKYKILKEKKIRIKYGNKENAETLKNQLENCC